MPKMKKCTVCGKIFLSHNGIEVCSTTCAIERKHRQDEKGNERRRYGLSNSNFEKICPICVKQFIQNTVLKNVQRLPGIKIFLKIIKNITIYIVIALLKNLRIIENVKNRHTDFYFCMPKIILRCCPM